MWKPGALSGHEDYEIHDELYTPDDRCVAVLECFATNPTVYYCNALTPAGEHRRIGAGRNLDTTKDWAERVTGLKPDVPIAGRRLEETIRYERECRVACSGCSGTGRAPHEEGPAGATWTVYDKCSTCKGRGYFERKN